MKPEYDSKKTDDPELAKELTLQVRKVIGPFAAPKKIVRVLPLSLTASGRRGPRFIPSFEGPIFSLDTLAPLGLGLTFSTSSPTYPRLEVERS
jgi:hypothetical protein